MERLSTLDPLAVVLAAAVEKGDVELLERHLRDRPALATARMVDARGVSRTLLHLVADWPGHRPRAAAMVTLLAQAGAELDASVAHTAQSGAPETALHWAASADDVAVLDALLDCGADIEAPGAVFTGGTAMSDAVIFAQWNAARRLLERGATTTLWQAAALGIVDRVEHECARTPAPTATELTNALWHACRGGQMAAAQLLVPRGAVIDWVGHDGKTPLDVARESDNVQLTAWLQSELARGD